MICHDTKFENLPPDHLYKYRVINSFTELMLENGELYFATSNELNDPFERFFSFKTGASNIVSESELPGLQTKMKIRESDGNFLVGLDSDENTKYMRDKNKQSESYGILSLCESNKSIPMCSHYADGFKGICIGFDWNSFGLTFPGSHPPQKNLPRKISYRDNPPVIHGYAHEWLEVFTTKSQDFSWEKEWRIFYTKGKLVGSNIRGAIKEIILGHNISKENITKIKSLVEDLNGVKLFITKPIVGKYQIEIKPYIDNEA